MCFYNDDYDWYAEINELRKQGPARKLRRVIRLFPSLADNTFVMAGLKRETVDG